MQAFLEHDHPRWSTNHDFEGCYHEDLDSIPPALLSMTKQLIAEKPSADDFPKGKGLILVRDDAAGDPASLATHCIGVMRSLYCYGSQAVETQGGFSAEIVELVRPLRNAVDQQLDFLLNYAPKVSIRN